MVNNNRNRWHKNGVYFPKDGNLIVLTTNMIAKKTISWIKRWYDGKSCKLFFFFFFLDRVDNIMTCLHHAPKTLWKWRTLKRWYLTLSHAQRKVKIGLVCRLSFLCSLITVNLKVLNRLVKLALFFIPLIYDIHFALSPFMNISLPLNIPHCTSRKLSLPGGHACKNEKKRWNMETSTAS